MKGFRWFVMFMIFLACVINFLDRSALAYVIEPLQQTYGLTNADFGLISSAFGISYLFMTFIGGLLVDKYGSRKILTLSSILWSVTSACIGLVTGFYSLFVLRVFLGMAEGPAFPSLTRVSSDWLPAKEKAKALALSLAAVSFSSVIGAPFITQLVSHFGWRTMFYILGSLGIVWSIVWFIIFRDQPQQNPYISEAEKNYIQSHAQHTTPKNSKAKVSDLFNHPQLLLAYVAYFCLGYLLSFSISWLPGYLHQTQHLSIEATGLFLTVPWLIATIFILIGGAYSDWLWQKTQDIRISRFFVIASGQILSALAFLPLLYSPSLVSTAVSISLGLGFGLLPMSAFYSLNSDLAHQQAATSQGIMSGCLGLASFIAPALTGYLAAQHGDFNQAILMIIGLSLSSAVLILVMQRPTKHRASSLKR
jgi:ACS family hexuronate transporter-like MFS transporter